MSIPSIPEAKTARRMVGTRGPGLPRARFSTLSVAVLLGLLGCDALFPDEEEAIDRDTFIETQVELRLAAMEAGAEEVPAARRDSILDEQGVSEEQLQAFITVHGSDEPFMNDVWAEVDRRVLEELGADPDEFPDPTRRELPGSGE